MILGTLEAGGTKMVCGIGDENGNVFERVSFPTRMPEETMADIIGYFKDKNIEALGIGKAPVIEKALPMCNIVCITGQDMVGKVHGYLNALYAQNPASVGGNAPTDAMYYFHAE